MLLSRRRQVWLLGRGGICMCQATAYLAEHAAEFRMWAGRARAAGEHRVAQSIESAAQSMEGSNTDLKRAAEFLQQRPSTD